jgi:hypothetical protein
MRAPVMVLSGWLVGVVRPGRCACKVSEGCDNGGTAGLRQRPPVPELFRPGGSQDDPQESAGQVGSYAT